MSSNAVSLIRLARSAEVAPRPRQASRTATRQTRTAGWAELLGRPSLESTRSREVAHLGGLAARTALAIGKTS